MKIRARFVSNSSSSSFVLDKGQMTEEQIEAVRNHTEYAKEHFPGQFYTGEEDYSSAAWGVTEGASIITVSTGMNNFDMWEFSGWIHVGKEAILRREDP